MASVKPSAAKKEQDISSVFIREFVRHLIINSKPKSNVDQEVINRVKAKLGIKLDFSATPSATKMPVQKVQLAPMSPSIMPPKKITLPPRRPLQFPARNLGMRPPMQQRPQPSTSKAPLPQKEQMNLGKIRQFLADAGVTGVECPGPGKNLLINHSGIIQTSPISLTAEEIDAILKEFSQKTKIPLITGVFKALYDNLLLTGIISDLAGSRFIIEKHFGQPSLPKKEDK